MLTLQYFARYREAIGVDQEQLEMESGWGCIDDLRRHLLQRGGVWAVLDEPRLMCARNQEMVGLDEPLADGAEIAFFPPVTGG